MIEFGYPWCFAALALPLLVNWLAPVFKEKRHSVKVPHFQKLVEVSGEEPRTGAVVLSRRRLQAIFQGVIWICIVVAMAKPEYVGDPIVQQRSGRDLMIAVDLSGSMEAEDFTTAEGKTVNRLQAVKEVLADFAQRREGDRLGLILFGDAPYLQAPFTGDIDTWLALLDEADINMAGPSTAFGDAIGLSISAFNNAGNENRMLIVLTDGNDTASRVPPIEAAKVAARYGIKIYTVAVGDPAAVGEEKVDLEVLQQVSAETGGKSYQALNRQELAAVHDDINQLETTLFQSQSYRPRQSIHHIPLALVYLMILLLLVARRALRTRVNNHV